MDILCNAVEIRLQEASEPHKSDSQNNQAAYVENYQYSSTETDIGMSPFSRPVTV